MSDPHIKNRFFRSTRIANPDNHLNRIPPHVSTLSSGATTVPPRRDGRGDGGAPSERRGPAGNGKSGAMVLVGLLLLGGLVVLTNNGSATFGSNTVITPHTYDATIDLPGANMDIDWVTANEYNQCSRDGATIYFSRTTDNGVTYVTSHVAIGTGLFCELVSVGGGVYYAIAGNVIYTSSDNGLTWTTHLTVPTQSSGSTVTGGCMAYKSGDFATVLVETGSQPGAYFSFNTLSKGELPVIGTWTEPQCGVTFGQDSSKIGVILGASLFRSVDFGNTFNRMLVQTTNAAVAGPFHNIETYQGTLTQASGTYNYPYYLGGGAMVLGGPDDGLREINVFVASSEDIAGTIVKHYLSQDGLTNYSQTGNLCDLSKIQVMPDGGFAIAWQSVVPCGTGCDCIRMGFLDIDPLVTNPVFRFVTVTSPGYRYFDLGVKATAPYNGDNVMLQRGAVDYFIASSGDVFPTGAPTPTPTPTPIIGIQEGDTWTTPIGLPAGGQVPSTISMSTIDETVGLVFVGTGDSNTRFLRRDGVDGVWTSINTDVTGADIVTGTGPRLALTSAGANNWVMCARLSVGGEYCYYSTDNGVTWTKSANLDSGSGAIFDVYHSALVTQVLFRHLTTDNLKFSASDNFGASWNIVNGLDISDNAGAPGNTATTNIDVAGASLIGVQGNRYTAYLTDSGTNKNTYHVYSDDGVFWTTPYTTELGTTLNPDTDPCPAAQYGQITAQGNVVGSTTNNYYITAQAISNNQYVCFHGHAVPSTSPTNQIQVPPLTANEFVSCNASDQCLIAIADLTANNDYVYYSSSGEQPVLKHTVNADTNVYAIVQTPTKGYFCYQNNAFAGRLECGDTQVFAGQELQQTVDVTNLVGYSMDSAGRNIIVRTDGGTVVRTYGVSNLVQIASVNTPNCGTSDQVNAQELRNTVYVVYVDCDGDGESDSFNIRTPQLTTPPLPCDDATNDIDNNALVDVPNNILQVGAIGDLPFDYFGRCAGQNNPLETDRASVGFSFSTVGSLVDGGGRIGVFAVTYNSGVIDDQTDEETVALDTTAFPQVDSFCDWTNPATGKDYIIGTSSQGATGAYEVISSVVAGTPDLGYEPVLELEQQFFNTGQYGAAMGVACAGNDIAILKATGVHWLTTVDGTETVVPGWPKTITDTETRGIAMTGSTNYLAYVDEGTIHVVNRAGTETGEYSIPSGTFRGMEFDSGGEHLAVFTSAHIKVINTTSATCELDNNCAQVGGCGSEGCAADNPPPVQPTPPPPHITGCPNDQDCDGFLTGDDPDDNDPCIPDTSCPTVGTPEAPDWVLPTVVTFLFALLVSGGVSLGFKLGGKGFGYSSLITGFLASIISIYFWGMPWFIPIILVVLPAIAIVVFKR